ncbi:hypothetical protein [Deinococcus sonorensis]|uniref:Uncharacterized protein n=2 Tax=Deinococcus sonorensis TaxID=309891 RepID=A0AAU7UGL6_9DEIO
MTLNPPRLGLLGEPEPADLPGLADLIRAVELGGEGGSLTLLGPQSGQGEFFVIRQVVLSVDDDFSVTSGGTELVPAGTELIPALQRLNPAWTRMLGLHVAPPLEAQVREALQRTPGARPWEEWRHPVWEQPLQCRFVWPACDLWPDGEAREGFWVEGSIDQVRATLGRLPYDHQVQLQTAANRPFVMLISRDGQERHALPDLPSSEDDPWPNALFQPLPDTDLQLIEELQYIPVPDTAITYEQRDSEKPDVLFIEPAMRAYEVYRKAERKAARQHPSAPVTAGAPRQALWRMAQLTWPFQVMRFEPDEEQPRPHYVVFLVHGMGMEEDLWTLPGEHRERDAVRLSIVLRNMYAAGQRDVLEQNRLTEYLGYALSAVRQVNATDVRSDQHSP